MSTSYRERLEAIAAVVAPLVAVAATVIASVAPQDDRHRTLISLWVALFFDVALFAAFTQALVDGTRREPRVIRWLNGVPRHHRARAAGARYAMLLLIGFAVLFAMKRVIRVKLDEDSAIVVAAAYAAFVLSFELGGWLLSAAPLDVKRWVRRGALVWLVLALGHTAIEAALSWPGAGAFTMQLIEGGPWRWFPFAGWVNGIYEALIRGARPPVLAMAAAFICGVASVVVYARHPA